MADMLAVLNGSTAMADSYDAMNSRRIYRNALPPEMIREEISKNRGKQFDPEITDVFLKLLDEKRAAYCRIHAGT